MTELDPRRNQSLCLIVILTLALSVSLGSIPVLADEKADAAAGAWKVYTNARFGFMVRYPPQWRLGDPLPEGAGVVLTTPVPKNQVALTGFLNLVEGKSRDGRQTLEEFATAHRRIMEEYYGKKDIDLKWQADRSVTLGGFPAKQLTFSYQDEAKTEIIEMHIFSLGRNEGRGVRIKFPASSRQALMPVLAEFLETYRPGRDQEAVSPFVQPDKPRPKEDPAR